MCVQRQIVVWSTDKPRSGQGHWASTVETSESFQSEVHPVVADREQPMVGDRNAVLTTYRRTCSVHRTAASHTPPNLAGQRAKERREYLLLR